MAATAHLTLIYGDTQEGAVKDWSCQLLTTWMKNGYLISIASVALMNDYHLDRMSVEAKQSTMSWIWTWTLDTGMKIFGIEVSLEMPDRTLKLRTLHEKKHLTWKLFPLPDRG